MGLRVKTVVVVVVILGIANLCSVVEYSAREWFHFSVYLLAVLLSSGMKIGMPKSDATMCVNFPFILLGILQLSPLQAVALAVCSVLAQCNIKVIKPFTLVQIWFNVANVTTATVLSWRTYSLLLQAHFETAPALAMSATVYFLATTLPVALIVAWESNTAPFDQWRLDYPWYLPFYLVGAVLAAAANWIGTSLGWMTSLLLIPMVYTIYRAYRAQINIINDRERHIVEMEALHLRTIEGLAMAIEAKDQSTHRHLLRVRVYVSEIGRMVGLDDSLMKALMTASFLHDIGKLAVPEHIINKPGKLTHEEFEKMKIHPVVGADILERVRFPYPVVPIVRSHHEAWDGSGYPDGLKGEAIPIGARILTAVDCFDALASERPYRKAMPLDEAIAFVKGKSGVLFDPKIVELLAQHYIALEEKARQNLEEMSPLNTDLLVERGAAPGAGFEPEFKRETVLEQAVSRGSGARPETHVRNSRNESLGLIAAASQEAKAVFELSKLLGSSLSSRETSSMIFHRLQPLIPFDCFTVFLKEESVIRPLYTDGPCASAFTSQAISIGEGLSGWVAESKRFILNGNPTVEPTYQSSSDLFTVNSSALSVPLFDLSGDVFGVLTLYSRTPATFSKDHLRILQAIESKFSLSLLNAQRFRIVEADAQHDYLTHLPNMRSFFKQVDAEVEKGRTTGDTFGVVVCDLNSFKAVNDRHGHIVGDQLLRNIADAFKGCCRGSDTVARMGGDEFVFLFPSMNAPESDQQRERIEEAVERACAQIHLDTQVSASIGVAFYPDDGESAEALLGTADRTMYLSKRRFYERARLAQSETMLESLTNQ